jgi:GAF domain-containing protein
MIVANELIGVLAVENDGGFSEREIELLRTIVGPLAIATNNLIQFEAIQATLEAQSRQRVQLQTAAAVAAAATSILDQDELMQSSVDLIKERFDLYYVGLFLVDSATNQAVLRAATGAAGRVQIEARHRLPVGGRSLIGGATYDGAPRITQDVTLDKEWFPNSHLPETLSELALPLRVRGQIIGALTVQSAKANVFAPELISTLQTMSDQLAIAIQNAQLLSHAEARARTQEELNQISAQLHRSADVDQIIAIGLHALSERLAGASVSLTLGRRQTNQDDDERRALN